MYQQLSTLWTKLLNLRQLNCKWRIHNKIINCLPCQWYRERETDEQFSETTIWSNGTGNFSRTSPLSQRGATFTGDPKYFRRTEPKLKTISFNFKQKFPEMLVEWIVHLIFHYKSCILIGWYINTRYLSAHTLWAEAIFSLCELVCESSLHRQPFKSVKKSGQIKLKNGIFTVLDWFRALCESCVADQSCHNFFIRAIWWQDLMINFACKLHAKFCACTIEHWRQRLLFAHQHT